MLNIELKPFSINKAWQGHRYKTTAYDKWRRDFCLFCKKILKNYSPIQGFVEVQYDFFLKHFKKADGENFIKTTSDALVETGIIQDDRFIKKYTVEKFMLSELDVEHIEILIFPWENSFYKLHSRVHPKEKFKKR